MLVLRNPVLRGNCRVNVAFLSPQVEKVVAATRRTAESTKSGGEFGFNRGNALQHDVSSRLLIGRDLAALPPTNAGLKEVQSTRRLLIKRLLPPLL